MLSIQIDIAAQDSSALASDVVLGPPGPMAWHLYATGLLHAIDPMLAVSLEGVTVGMRRWRLDTRQSPYGPQPDNWVPRRHVFDGVTLKNTFEDSLAIGDDIRADLKASVLIEVDQPGGRAAEIAEAINQVLPGRPCFGGVLDFEASCAAVASDPTNVLQGTYLLVDRTRDLARLASRFERSRRDVLIDIAFRGVPDPVIGPDYVKALKDLGFVSPTPIGYRLLTQPSTQARGRRNDLPHAWAETITGLAAYIPWWRIQAGIADAARWTYQTQDNNVFFMEHA